MPEVIFVAVLAAAAAALIVATMIFTGTLRLYKTLAFMWAVQPQIFATTALSTVPLVQAVLLPFYLLSRKPRVPSYATWLCVYGLFSLLSMIWSPSPGLAWGAGITVLGVSCMLIMASNVRSDERSLYQLIGLLGLVATVQSLSILLFRLFPSVEEAYVRSSISPVLLGPRALGISDGTTIDNWSDVEKSGGILFLNANTASMVCGVAALVMFSGGVMIAKRGYLYAAVSLMGAVATGSKTALILCIALPLMVVLVGVASSPRGRGRWYFAFILVLVIGFGAIQVVVLSFPEFVDALDETLVPRRALWSTAIEFVRSGSLLGLGYGGWEQQWPSIGPLLGFPARYPPHNAVLASGVSLGYVGIVLVLGFYVSVARHHLRAARLIPNFRTRLAIIALFGAWLWVIVHGQADPTPFWGDIHAVAYLALGATFMVRVTSTRFSMSDDGATPSVRYVRTVKVGRNVAANTGW